MVAAEPQVVLTLFERHVKQALRLFAQPERLGAESPLASPYMLGRALRDRPRPATARVRGEVLRAEIRAAARRLWRGPFPANHDEMIAAICEARRDPDDPRYSYVVFELRCFNDFITPYRTSDIWEQPHLLPGSKSQHYRDFDEAVRRLARVLLDGLRPTLRAEQPQPPATLYGYDRQLAQLSDALASGRSVALTGPGGVGKTSIGAKALAGLGRPSFWYTLRPGFNDGAGSLLFALGAFLHEQGASDLWQYLVAANGALGDVSVAAGLLRHDLAQLGDRPPVLCIDDVEHLAVGNLAVLTPAHMQVLDIIEGLRGLAPLLLISQRPLPASDVHLELAGLSADDVARLWQGAGRPLAEGDAVRLHAYTGGNPRLLTLMLALQTDAEAVLPQPGEPGAAPSLMPAFQRLWRRLTADERRALQRLSVYQGAVPEDVVAPATIASLAQLRLVELDGAGGIGLLPALAPIVHDDLSPELRETLHREAAVVRLERGEYTAAAYHFAQGQQEDRAVQVWFSQRRHAIARGEADAARQVFNRISRQRLARGERAALDIIRAELRQMAGQGEEALRELEQRDWSDESEANVRLWMLRGELEEALGYPDQALSSYDAGVQVAARLLGQVAALHQRRGLLFHRRKEHQASWQAIHHAEFELMVLRGLVREEEGAYADALAAYQQAAVLAEQLDDDSLRAQAERRLASLHGRRQSLDDATRHAARALAIYERLGDRLNLEKMRANLAFIYVQTRQFHAALEVGAPAYAFFAAARDPYVAGAAGANLAEASFEIGDLDGAARYATEVLALGHRHAAPYAHFTLGQVALARKDSAAAAASFAESMALAQQNDDPYMVAYAERSLGQARLAADDAEAAENHFRGALALFRQLDIPGEIAATEQLLASLASAV